MLICFEPYNYFAFSVREFQRVRQEVEQYLDIPALVPIHSWKQVEVGLLVDLGLELNAEFVCTKLEHLESLKDCVTQVKVILLERELIVLQLS